MSRPHPGTKKAIPAPHSDSTLTKKTIPVQIKRGAALWLRPRSVPSGPAACAAGSGIFSRPFRRFQKRIVFAVLQLSSEITCRPDSASTYIQSPMNSPRVLPL